MGDDSEEEKLQDSLLGEKTNVRRSPLCNVQITGGRWDKRAEQPKRGSRVETGGERALGRITSMEPYCPIGFKMLFELRRAQ